MPYSAFKEVLWAFSIYLESVAILPQLFMLQRTGEAETITTHYLFALGAYRALYIPNWIYRYFTEDTVDVSILSGFYPISYRSIGDRDCCWYCAVSILVCLNDCLKFRSLQNGAIL